MASSIVSSAAVASVNRTSSPAQAAMVAPFTGLKSAWTIPMTRKVNNDITTLASNGGRVQCMQVWPPVGRKKFETLSYLPERSPEQLAKEIDYLIRNKWVPSLEFELEHPFVFREHNKSPGYYDGRYWVMWKLPMFGCNDASQVLKELNECKTAYPNAFIRIIGFDNSRQVQCVSFIAYKPPGF
ncbi:ribulose bisphosphate carboxylase small subunit, chloroplastic-like [Corylus avellana]|uniref:ribulose bisphosphate carboxylase small subunit, chloroplastic-like n=1 Tax=Corylus avellana TaxID=13451 RepID=UPI001E2211A3|nr:ribulose bisphosphate carboxylase small subunit, chloroplastic-like [Corylus avellana]XP_059455476.1 ribulose bisphosphate carboxylase small subunit, chloroplastic-like [Corylus avellana]